MNRRTERRARREPSQPRSALHARVRQMLTLERMCTRFHHVAQQLQHRHADRPTLAVQDEHDVRDLLRALLALEHDEVRPITWTPSYAGGIARTDFWLKLESIVVVARMASAGMDADVLRAQLTEDAQHHAPHTRCHTLVCFVYDPDGRMADPRGLESALSGEQEGVAVRVIVGRRGV